MNHNSKKVTVYLHPIFMLWQLATTYTNHRVFSQLSAGHLVAYRQGVYPCTLLASLPPATLDGSMSSMMWCIAGNQCWLSSHTNTVHWYAIHLEVMTNKMSACQNNTIVLIYTECNWCAAVMGAPAEHQRHYSRVLGLSRCEKHISGCSNSWQ